MPKVLNKRIHGIPQGAVYVGRPTKWGNPFSHLQRSAAVWKVETVQEAVDAYAAWVVQQPELMASLPELTGKDLVCWGCNPCHAQILIKLANR